MAISDDFAAEFGPYFTYNEFRCKCDACRVSIDDGVWFRNPEFKAFMKSLIWIREEVQFPFIINSGYRCPAYNNEISSTGPRGPHTMGAADIKVAFERAYELVNAAFVMNMGVGISQKGEVASRFIHVDNMGKRLWSY